VTLTEIVDGLFGDCGKGVLTAYIATHDDAHAAVRIGGPQAGHTTVFNGVKYFTQQLPSALFNPDTELLLAVGAFVNPDVVLKEVKRYEAFNVEKRLKIDENATVILPEHIEREKELKGRIGSVGTGVGPAYADRVMRRPDILVKDVPELREFSKDVCVSEIVNGYLDKDLAVVIEGSHGTFLSNYHGTYPHTNAYNNDASSVLGQVGIGPRIVDDVIVVFKGFVTRVGAGPLEGELSAEESDKLGWTEYGTVSGRLRRAAPFNIDLAKKAIMLNRPTQLALTKMDVLFPDAYGVTDFIDLLPECQERIKYLEGELHVPITLIKTGPEIRDIVDLREEKGFL
jgi:adenylosuccinate synthase